MLESGRTEAYVLAYDYFRLHYRPRKLRWPALISGFIDDDDFAQKKLTVMIRAKRVMAELASTATRAFLLPFCRCAASPRFFFSSILLFSYTERSAIAGKLLGL